MNEIEFEKEARRIAIAFGLPSDIPIKVNEHLHYNPNTPRVYFKTDSFELLAFFYEANSGWVFELWKDKNVVECVSWPDDDRIGTERDSPELQLTMIRGMYVLGYEVEDIEEWFSLTFTAHEKLEWQLEFARRMREDARENGA